MNKALLFLIGLLLLLPVSGELWRLSVFGVDLLPSDLLIPVLFVLWVADKLKNDCVFRVGKIGRFVLLFLFAVLFGYALNLFRFPFVEMLTAFTYLGRFFMYAVLTFIVYDLSERDGRESVCRVVLGGTLVSFLLISTLGFLQLWLFPSFLDLGLDLAGWDPHVGRLLSTWFDPNFVGGYLAFSLSIVFALGLYARHQRRTVWFFALAGLAFLGLAALYYTFSRSGYLAMAAVIFVLAFLKSRKLLFAVFCLAVLGFAFSPRVQERVGEGWESGKALFGIDSQSPLDPTARLRVESWSRAIDIIADHPWIGVGYSRYAYEINQRGYGLLSDHDAGGSDSSLLTIWATTGIVGLAAYLFIGFSAAVAALKNSWQKSDFLSYLSAGLLAGFTGMAVHSVFVNSLLFPLIMVYLWMGLALLDEPRSTR